MALRPTDSADITVKVSQESSSTILYSESSSSLIKQIETVTTIEHRGLTQSAAEGLCSPTTTDLVQTTWYKTIDGEVKSFTATTGSKKDWTIARDGDSEAFTATERTTLWVMNPSSPSGWSTTNPSGGGGGGGSSGFVSGLSRTRRILTEVSGNELIATETDETTEWRGLSAAEAAYLVNTCPADSLVDREYVCRRIATEIGRYTAQSGTRYSIQARFVSDTEGWSVTRTQTTIAVAGSNWSVAT